MTARADGDAVGPMVVLLRHGETAWNAEGRFQGQHDTSLTEVGRDQARAAARDLALATSGRPVRLVSSDLDRARSTADALADELGVPLATDQRLREVHAGAWQGLLQREIEARDPAAYSAWRAGDDVVLGGAERPSQAGERVRAAVEEHAAAAAAEGGWLVVVGHGASIRAGLSALLGQPGLRRVLVPMGNTGAALLAPGEDAVRRWRLHGWNVPPSALAEALGRRGSASAAVT